MISSGGQAPHVLRAHTGVHRTCGEPDGIGLTAIGVELNGSGRVPSPLRTPCGRWRWRGSGRGHRRRRRRRLEVKGRGGGWLWRLRVARWHVCPWRQRRALARPGCPWPVHGERAVTLTCFRWAWPAHGERAVTLTCFRWAWPAHGERAVSLTCFTVGGHFFLISPAHLHVWVGGY